MPNFGTTPKDNAGVPIAEVYVPGTSNSDLTALEGIVVNTDGNGQKSAAVRFGLLDGDNVTQGAKGNAAATDSTSSWSVIALLKGIFAKLAGTLTVGGSVSVSNLPGTQPVSGTVTSNAGTNLNTSALALEAGGNLATLVTNTADLLADGDHLATIDTSTAAAKTDLDTIVTNTGKVPPASAWTQIYQTTQTGVSSWAGSGDISGIHVYSALAINVNVSAITGTSITVKVARKDSFGNYINIAPGAAISAVGSQAIDIGPGLSTNRTAGDILQITATFTSITSITFTIDAEAR